MLVIIVQTIFVAGKQEHSKPGFRGLGIVDFPGVIPLQMFAE